MKIIITEPELTQIVRSHVLSTVQLQNGSDIAIDFSATRGADGVTATIDIPYVGVQALDLGATKAPDTAPKQEAAKPPKAARIAPTAAAAATPVQKQVVTDGVGIFAGAKAEADAVVVTAGVAEAPFELATAGDASDTAAAVVEAEAAAVDPGPGSAAVSLFP